MRSDGNPAVKIEGEGYCKDREFPSNFDVVPNLFSGKSSGKFCTQRSGYLSHVKPDDASLWDKGFDVHDLIALRPGKCFAPPKTRKCKYGKEKRY